MVVWYEFVFKTGDIRGAGTDADIFVSLHGKNGMQTGKIMLGPHHKNVDRSKILERNCTDTFRVRTLDVGCVTSMKVGHDNKGKFPAWYLEWVTLRTHDHVYWFSARRWIGLGEADHKLEIELTPRHVYDASAVIKYEFIVKTGDVRGAGTDANVFVCVFGEDGKNTGNIVLCGRDGDRSKVFKRNGTDRFAVEAIDVGDVQYIKIGHDNTRSFSGWYLESVSMTTNRQYQMFTADRWLDHEMEDGRLECDLHPKPMES